MEFRSSDLMKRRQQVQTQIGRFLRIIFPAASIVVAGSLVLFVVLVYKITHPGAVSEPITPSDYFLPSREVLILPADGAKIPGWWIPGSKGSPGIILAPGYGMSRSDALSLANALHEKGFNILIYSQRGNGASSQESSTLGLYETGDMLEALRLMQAQPEAKEGPLGIWGVDIGAFAALKAAASMTVVRAIAVDGIFASPADFLNLRIVEDFGMDNWFLRFGCRQIFRLAHIASQAPIDEKLALEALSDRTILFIKGENRERLGRLTAALYEEIRPQKEMVSLKAARVHLMGGEELRSYDRQVTNFFHLNLQ